MNRLLFRLITVILFTSPWLISCSVDREQDVPVTDITISQSTAEMIIGQILTLRVTISPSDATDKVVTWASSSSEVASVSPSGLVTALAEGSSAITATVGGKTAACVITVSSGYVSVESISLDYSELQLIEGDEFKIKAIVKPDDASEKTVIWSSSNNEVATVDADGKVKAIEVGSVVIAATAGQKTATCMITVTARKVDVSEVLLNKTTLSMIVGEEFDLVATIIPDNASVKEILWSTSNSEVATIDGGKVKAVKEGQAKIIASVDGKNAECDVTVDYIPVQNISLDKSTLTFYEGGEYILAATVSPDNATYQDITWTSSNPMAATVDNGKVVALKKGTTTIKAEANGKQAECQVTVLSSMVNITLNKNNLKMLVGDSESLSVTLTPADATLREPITWTTSNDKVATVDENGKVVAIKEGSAIITAMVEGKKADCLIDVDYVHVSSIVISQSTASLYIGESVSLSATPYPSNATYGEIEWASSNAEVATVSEDGQVTAVGKGLAIISAKSEGMVANCEVSVLIPPASLCFDQVGLTLYCGEEATLSLILTPVDAELKGEIMWSTSDENVATVAPNGLVHAVSKGSATITASVDGCSATCPVTVGLPVTGISLNETFATMNVGDVLRLTYQLIPADAISKSDVLWESMDPYVATVDNHGNVTAVGGGETAIQVSLDGIPDFCFIRVIIPVTSVALNKTTMALMKGESEALVATVNPSNATIDTMSWESSNPSVATVDNQGLVTAVDGGNATITVTVDGKTATCDVTVSVPVPVASVTLDKTELYLNRGDDYNLIATVSPSDATDKTITWRSSDYSIARVSSDGRVSARQKVGDVIITATAESGAYAECLVHVIIPDIPVSSITLSCNELALIKGQSFLINAWVLPYDATNQTVIWYSSNTNVATVQDGLITAVKSGQATITASVDGLSASCIVTVTTPVTSVSLDQSLIELEQGQRTTLVATVLPEDADDKTVIWTTSDPNVAKVSSFGEITAITEGKAVIQAKVGDYLSQCVVIVKKKIIPVTSIVLDVTSVSLNWGESITINATVNPSTATYPDIEWISSDSSIASITDYGSYAIIGAKRAGTVVITAKSWFYEEIYATCVVTIRNNEKGSHEGTEYENWD